jgi:hypothetical protein
VEAEEAAGAELDLACTEAARQLGERRARLNPALPDLDLFAAAPSPDAVAIDEAAKQFDALAARRDAALRQAEAARDKAQAAAARLDDLEKSGTIASRHELRALRVKRAALWSALRQARGDEALWLAQAPHFEDIQAQADAQADALIGDAARVAEAEAERATRSAAETDLGAIEKSLHALDTEAQSLAATWTQAWAACGVKPVAPRAMTRWRAEADHLLASRETLRGQQTKRDAAQARLRALLPGLERLAAEVGLSTLALSAGAQAKRIATRLKDLAKASEEARALAAQLVEAPTRVAAQQKRLAAIEEEERLWRHEFSAALAQLRLDAGAGFDEARARVNLWRALPGEWEDHAGSERQVTSIQRDYEAFKDMIIALASQCAPDLQALAPLDAARALQRRLVAERSKATTRANAEKQIEKLQAAFAACEHRAAQADAALNELATGAGFSGDVAVLSESLRSRRTHQARIDAETERLALVAEGAEEAQLACDAENFDAGAARLRLDEISSGRDSRQRQGQESYAARSAALAELARHEESSGAEQAIFSREAARADIVGESRRWATLRLASLLVGAGLERHRQTRQDPLLARAGKIFSGLTLERYAGLKQEFGEDDVLQLRALRADGAALGLKALSEGARDQLYLALRLAFIEDYAGRSEAPPFIGDDLFASFDDERLASGLAALAAASGAIQPIVFTHHAHIVEIARARLGGQAQILQLQA